MKNLIYIIALVCLVGCGGNNQFEEIENCSKKEIRFNSLDVEKLLVPDCRSLLGGCSAYR